VDVTTGVVVTIPPNSIYHKSFDDSKEDEISDWTTAIESLPTDFDHAVNFAFAVGGALALDLTGDVLGIASAQIGIALAAPNIKGTFKTSTDPDPCHDPNGENGHSLEVDVGMALEAYEVAKLGKEIKAEQTFFSTATQLYSTCIAASSGTQSTTAG
jgi:hypothetical protein